MTKQSLAQELRNRWPEVVASGIADKVEALERENERLKKVAKASELAHQCRVKQLKADLAAKDEAYESLRDLIEINEGELSAKDAEIGRLVSEVGLYKSSLNKSYDRETAKERDNLLLVCELREYKALLGGERTRISELEEEIQILRGW